MPSAPTTPLWDTYTLMVEKSPANTILLTGAILILTALFFLFLVLAFSPGLRSFLRDIIKGLRYSEGKLAYEGSPKSDETAVQTDEKGNVKPPVNPSEPEDGAQQSSSEADQFFWLFKIEHAWKDTDGPLTKVSEYYDNIQKLSGPLPEAFIEAEYLLARFRCGDASALETLRTKAGASPDAYAANGVLGRYYELIGEIDEALKCLKDRFEHASNSDRKLHSARALATFLSETGRWEDGLVLLRNQLSYFQSARDQAILWETIGTIYDTKKLNWQKHLCFEKALKLNPNNTALRFSLAYSYGENGFGTGMAAYHYGILLKQRPGYSMATNNLSVIYDQVGGTTTKISLLQEAVPRKDNSYVAANLAIAYAKAGFIDDARKHLQDIAANEQQEGIVRAAYRNIADQLEADAKIGEKLNQLMSLERHIVYDEGLPQLEQPEQELRLRFLGEWAVPGGMVLSTKENDGKLTCELTAENDHYEHASYSVTPRYEPGILELDASLDEKSVKERPTASRSRALAGGGLFGGLGGIGGSLATTNSLLGMAFSRPSEVCMLVLVPGANGSLVGLLATSSRNGLLKKDQTLLSAKKVLLTKLDAENM